MSSTNKYKYGSTMLVKEDTKERLNGRGIKTDSYDGILNKMIDELEKFDKIKAMPEFIKFAEKHKLDL